MFHLNYPDKRNAPVKFFPLCMILDSTNLISPSCLWCSQISQRYTHDIPKIRRQWIYNVVGFFLDICYFSPYMNLNSARRFMTASCVSNTFLYCIEKARRRAEITGSFTYILGTGTRRWKLNAQGTLTVHRPKIIIYQFISHPEFDAAYLPANRIILNHIYKRQKWIKGVCE